MEDDADSSGALDGSKANAQKNSKDFRTLMSEIEQLKVEITKKELELLASKSDILSSVLHTANELERNDAQIAADLCRQAANVTVRSRRTVKTCDKGTQTSPVRMVSRRVQMDSWETVTRLNRYGHCHRRQSEPNRFRNCRERPHNRGPRTPPPVYRRDRRRDEAVPRREWKWEQYQNRERERELRARHYRTLRWPSEVSSRYERSRTDTKSDTTRSIRSGTRSPDESSSPGAKQMKNETLDACATSELWDVDGPVKKEVKLIQSDEIGTSLVPALPQLLQLNMKQDSGMPDEEDSTRNNDRKLKIEEPEEEKIPSSETVIDERQMKVAEAVEPEQEQEKIVASEGDSVKSNDVDHDGSSDKATFEREKDEKKSKKKAKRLEKSLRHARKRHRSKSDADGKSRRKLDLEPGEIPTVERRVKSKIKKMKELFGSDDDDVLCMPLEAGKRKRSVIDGESTDDKKQKVHSEEIDGEDTTRAEIECSGSANETIIPSHSTSVPSGDLEKADSLEDTLQEKITSKEDHLAIASQQHQSPTINALSDEIPVQSSQQDQPLGELSPEQPSAEAFQHDQLPMEISTTNEILPPPDDPVDDPSRTSADASQSVRQSTSPEVVVFSNRYSEYRVEDNEAETTIYMTRKKTKKKKKQSKSDSSSLDTTAVSQC